MFMQGPIFSLRDKQLFEISEVEITRVNCMLNLVIASSLPLLLVPRLCFMNVTSPRYARTDAHANEHI